MQRDSSRKLTQFRQEARRSQIACIMLKIRDETICHFEQQQLKAITSLDPSLLGQEHIKTLISYVNKDSNNAIIYLGNLIIDRCLLPEHLDGTEWQIGQSQYWAWLINVFSEAGYLTEEMIDYLLDKTTHRKSQSNLENVLQALQRCCTRDESFTISKILKYDKVLFSLLNHIQDPHEKLFLMSLKLLVTLTSSQNFPGELTARVGKGRVEKALLHASMKLSRQGRLFAVQAANNFLMSGISLDSTLARFLENAEGEHLKLKIELSYLFTAMARHLGEEQLRNYIENHRFAHILQTFAAEAESNHGDAEILRNVQDAMHVVGVRFFRKSHSDTRDSIDPNSMPWEEVVQGAKMRDENQDVTGYPDCL